MGKLLCFVYDTMADFETNLAAHMLADADKEVLAIGYEKRLYKGLSNFNFATTYTVKEALDLKDIEGILIPGGWERDCREELITLIQNLYADNKLVASICAGPEFLAKAGVLEGHKFTTTMTPERYEELACEDPFNREHYLNQRVVVDRNIITAVGRAYIEFGLAILDYFKSFENVEERASYIEMYRGYVDS